jgi:Nickel responsive protein SCO4226-like
VPRFYLRREIAADGRIEMPRYVIERVFPDGWAIPVGAEGREHCLAIVERNADEGVTWVHSYVSEDRKKTFCIYEAPTPEALRRTAMRSDLPVERITEVSVFDPYFYI